MRNATRRICQKSLVRDRGKSQKQFLACIALIKYRVRGYQFKSEGKGEARKNPPAYRSLDDGKEKQAEAALPNPNVDAEDLEKQGFAKKTD